MLRCNPNRQERSCKVPLDENKIHSIMRQAMASLYGSSPFEAEPMASLRTDLMKEFVRLNPCTMSKRDLVKAFKRPGTTQRTWWSSVSEIARSQGGESGVVDRCRLSIWEHFWRQKTETSS